MKAILTALALAIAATMSYACSCSPDTNVVEQVALNDVIFTGRCTGGTLRGDIVAYEFGDTRALKGPERPSATVLSPSGAETCGYRFAIGEEYLVYSFSREGELWTDACRPTKRIDGSEEVKAEMEEIVNLQSNAAPQAAPGE
jgi:hypothetical protein